MHSCSCWMASLWCNSSYSSAKDWVLSVLWWTLGLHPKIQEWRTLWDSDETIWVGPCFELWHPWVSATAIIPAWFRDGCACRTASNWWPHTRVTQSSRSSSLGHKIHSCLKSRQLHQKSSTLPILAVLSFCHSLQISNGPPVFQRPFRFHVDMLSFR